MKNRAGHRVVQFDYYWTVYRYLYIQVHFNWILKQHHITDFLCVHGWIWLEAVLQSLSVLQALIRKLIKEAVFPVNPIPVLWKFTLTKPRHDAHQVSVSGLQSKATCSESWLVLLLKLRPVSVCNAREERLSIFIEYFWILNILNVISFPFFLIFFYSASVLFLSLPSLLLPPVFLLVLISHLLWLEPFTLSFHPFPNPFFLFFQRTMGKWDSLLVAPSGRAFTSPCVIDSVVQTRRGERGRDKECSFMRGTWGIIPVALKF